MLFTKMAELSYLENVSGRKGLTMDKERLKAIAEAFLNNEPCEGCQKYGEYPIPCDTCAKMATYYILMAIEDWD